MAKPKEDLSAVSLNQLSILTGKSWKALKMKLSGIDPIREDGNTLYYDPRQALSVIYHEENDGETLDLSQERAKLAKAQTEKISLELEVTRKNLIPAEVIKDQWEKAFAVFKVRILTLPSKLATRAATAGDPKKVEKLLREECESALKELSGYRV